MSSIKQREYTERLKQDDLLVFRQEFLKIDPTSPQHLRKWFLAHPYLTNHDLAIIANRSSNTIRCWRRKAGISNPRPRSTYVPKVITSPALIEVPSHWNTRDWLEQQLQRHSTESLAKAIGITWATMRKYLHAHGLRPKTHREAVRSTNACCNHAWCWRHYMELGLSAQQCAKLAGVSTETFRVWMTSLRIPLRSSRANVYRSPALYWLRQFIFQLLQQSVVRRVYLRDTHVHVRFRNFWYETYYFIPKATNAHRRYRFSHFVTREDCQIKQIPQVNHEYESGLDGSDGYPAHLIINRRDWQRATFMERRLALQEFIRQHVRREWIWPKYPERVLTNDLQRLKSVPESPYIKKGAFAVATRGTSGPGRYLMLHFFDTAERYARTFRSPRLITHLANFLAAGATRKINTHNLFRLAGILRPNLQLCDPVVYSVVLRRLGITGLVFDLIPGIGNRALACAALGLRYTTLPSPEFDRALAAGVCEFTGLKYEPFTNQVADLMIADANFSMPDLTQVFSYAATTKRLLLFVPAQKRSEIQAKYKPESIIKVYTRYRQQSCDYWFVY